MEWAGHPGTPETATATMLPAVQMSHGSERRARDTHLTIRLTKEERAAIDEAAEAAGLAAGSYARRQLIGAGAPRAVKRARSDRAELVRLLAQFGRVGSNLNQIARKANSGEDVNTSALAAALGNLDTMRDAVMQALGRAP